MALSEKRIQENKQEFINLVNSIGREDFDKSRLLFKLENSDFFKAPASTKYNNSYEGGLCEHSIAVYRALKTLVMSMGMYNDGTSDKGFTEDTLLIVGLFHDFSKMNFYETYAINKKVYSENGSKEDNLGKFDWKSEKAFKVKEAEDRYVFGTAGQNSERMLSYFISLSEQESAAIIWHRAGMDNHCSDMELNNVLNKYPLVVLLHVADMMCSYIK